MTLLKRTLLLVTSLLAITVLVTAGAIAVSAHQSILAQAETDSRVIRGRCQDEKENEISMPYGGEDCLSRA
jgi:hypothetical protein